MANCAYFKPIQNLACADTAINSPTLSHTCDVGCEVCGQDPDGPDAAVRVSGKRWMRPHFTRESRDANGRHLALVTGSPMRIPQWWFGQMAQCWSNGGNEFFDSTFCNCPHKNCGGSYGPQDWPTETCAVTVGFGPWPPELLCAERARPEFELFTISATGGRIGQGTYVSAETKVNRGGPTGSDCTSNVAAKLWGHVENIGSKSPCPPPMTLTAYYNNAADGQMFSIFDYCRIVEFTGRFHVAQTAPERAYVDVAVAQAKNGVLSSLGRDLRHVGMDQLDSPRRLAGGPGTNLNSQLDVFEKSYNLNPLDLLQFDQLRVARTFPNSFLRHSGCKLSTCEYVVVGVRLEMSLVLHRVITCPEEENLLNCTRLQQGTVRPSVRVRLEVNMGVRAALEGGSCDFNGTTITLSESSYAQRYPRVLPAGADEIVYVDGSGRRLVPPRRIVWWGDLGPFSDPIWPALEGSVLFPNQPLGCSLALQMSDPPLEIPALGSHQESLPGGSAQQVYSGSLKIDWPNRLELGCL
ncbi:MAG: hypothetical protein IIC01_08915 [Planctomycetes bacterium]|nr:hypothetical protein [Planctomycetota bacterium]